MGRGLVRHGIGANASLDHLRQDLGRVAEQSNGHRLPVANGLLDDLHGLFECLGPGIEIARFQAHIDAIGLAFHGQHRRTGHGRGQRLRAAHAAKAGRQYPAAAEIAAIVLPAHLDESLVGALHDSLAADVDPGPGGHLAEHHQALPVQLAKMLPGGPRRHQVRIRDQHAWRIPVGSEHADRLARLHQQSLVVTECLQRGDDRIETFPVASRFTDAAVYNEILWPLGDFRVEVVHQHPERRLGQPAPGLEGRSRSRFDYSFHWRNSSSCTTSADADRVVPGGM